MHYKVKNTLVGLVVATSMIGASYSISRPPQESQVRVDFTAPGVEARVADPLEELQIVRKRYRGMRSQLSMPFFSFAPLLPRRES